VQFGAVVSRERIEKICNYRENDWKNATVIDLGRFKDCQANSREGEEAKERFDYFVEHTKGDRPDPKVWRSPKNLAPRNASQYIRTLLGENSKNLKLTAECSTFSYSAIGTMLLDKEIRQQYDICQVGTMHIDQGMLQMPLGLIRQSSPPTIEQMRQLPKSQYIVTETELWAYNKAVGTLEKLEINEDEVDDLNAHFKNVTNIPTLKTQDVNTITEITGHVFPAKVRLSFAHNICLLIPRGEGESLRDVPRGKHLNKEDLPTGAVIIDPWARALGHPADRTLNVTLDNFEFKSTFFPFVINYNSGEEYNLEEQITNINKELPLLAQDYLPKERAEKAEVSAPGPDFNISL
jgi:hypothetical protein